MVFGTPDLSVIVAEVAIGIVIGVISSWVTVQLSLRRFRTEKWWERKVAAYERLIDALHDSKAYTEAHLDATIQNRDLSPERIRELDKPVKAAQREISKVADVAGFTLSPKAHERLKKYRKEVAANGECPNWWEYLELDLAATTSCLSDLIEIAREDLRTK